MQRGKLSTTFVGESVYVLWPCLCKFLHTASAYTCQREYLESYPATLFTVGSSTREHWEVGGGECETTKELSFYTLCAFNFSSYTKPCIAFIILKF